MIYVVCSVGVCGRMWLFERVVQGRDIPWPTLDTIFQLLCGISRLPDLLPRGIPLSMHTSEYRAIPVTGE